MAISDVLFEACEEMEEYLQGYSPEEAAPYAKLVALMRAMCGYLDAVPAPSSHPEFDRLSEKRLTEWMACEVTPVIQAHQAVLAYCAQAQKNNEGP
jgi:hypothetical protein